MMQKIPLIIAIGLCCWLILIVVPALDEESTKVSQEFTTAAQAMEAVKLSGPAEIDLREQAVLNIPKGYAFVPMPAAGSYARALCNKSNGALIGLIFPERSEDGWVGVVEYVDAGYVKEDKALSWQLDELLNSYKHSIEANNLIRIKHGFSALEVAGWELRPNYDAANHRLAWAAEIKSQERSGLGARSMAYNTYLLGREGYFSLSLVADMGSVGELKSKADTLASALIFRAGKAYGDFDALTDKSAGYDISALVQGIDPQRNELWEWGAIIEKCAQLAIAMGIAMFGVSLGEVFKRNKKTGMNA